MKFLIRLSGICSFLILFFLPLSLILRQGMFTIPSLILVICVSIVCTTLIALQKYADRISKMEKSEDLIRDREKELDTLIKKYNSLILQK